MGWNLYTITFKVKSPIHIGYHKVMHLYKTRLYIPAKPLWGALTAKLTRLLNLTNYEDVGEFLKKSIRFGYLYIYDGNNIIIPKYTDLGLKFGDISKVEFEKRFIGSFTSTSIDSFTFTAEEGMLHEIEFIKPYEGVNKPVFLKGLLWIREYSYIDFTIQKDNNDFIIMYNKKEFKFSDLLKNLQIGGERKYGFGLIVLDRFERASKKLAEYGFFGEWIDSKNSNDVLLKLGKDEYIWSHVQYNPHLKIKGYIEPIVGRDWSDKGAGRKLQFYGLCWAPGSKILEDRIFKVTENFGIWVADNHSQTSP